MTLSGNQKRKMKSAARLYAVQALYQMEQSNQTFDQVRIEFLDHRFGEVFEDYEMIEGDVGLFSILLENAFPRCGRRIHTDRHAAKSVNFRVCRRCRSLFP